MLFFETTAPDLDDPWLVSPGIEGFIAFAVLGIAVWLLGWLMVRSIRRANFRAAEREEELYGPDSRVQRVWPPEDATHLQGTEAREPGDPRKPGASATPQ